MDYAWQLENWPNLTYDESAFRADFERVLVKTGELAGMRVGLSDEDRFATFVNELSDETTNSFAIEGEDLDKRAMRDSLIASLLNRDRGAAGGGYRNVADVMIDARDTSRPMTVERLNGWHQLLFDRSRFLSDVGQLRSEEMQVVTQKNFEVTEVHFAAPPPERMPAEMAGLMDWIARTSPEGPEAQRFQTPGRAALAHLRFETIHPYSDGNGRIGRALADFVMAQNETFSRAPFSMSRVIQADKNSYYDALMAAQAGTVPTRDGALDMTPFVGWFAKTMDQAIDHATVMALHINSRNRFFERFAGDLDDRQDQALRDLFERGPERLEEGLSARRYRRTTGVSRQTASRDLADLVEKGVLLPPTQGGRSTSYAVNVGAQMPPDSSALARDEAMNRIKQFEGLAEKIADPERQARAYRQIGAMRAAAGMPVDRGRDDKSHPDLEPELED